MWKPRGSELPLGVWRVIDGNQRAYMSRTGDVFPYSEHGASKSQAFRQAIEASTDTTPRIAMPSYDGGPPEMAAGDERFFVGANLKRYPFACEATRRLARLTAWSGYELPPRYVPQILDGLVLVDSMTGHVSKVFPERPFRFTTAVSYLLRQE